MDDNTLAAQYAQTGDLMDLCHNDAWLRGSAWMEDEDGGQVEAGLAMKEYSRAMNALTTDSAQQLRQQMRVQSILFDGLRQWMESWDLGAGFDDTYTIARRLIRGHLAHPTPNQATFIERIVTEDDRADSEGLTQEQVVTVLSEMFSQEDWQAMAKAASQSVSLRVLNAGQAQTETAVA